MIVKDEDVRTRMVEQWVWAKKNTDGTWEYAPAIDAHNTKEYALASGRKRKQWCEAHAVPWDRELIKVVRYVQTTTRIYEEA